MPTIQHYSLNLLLVWLTLLASASGVRGEGWIAKTEMPTRRFDLATAVVEGNIYAMGGATSPNNVLSTVEVYDPASDAWTRLADLNRARAGLSATVVGGRIYAIGGITSQDEVLSTVEVYDPASDIWARVADLPVPRAYAASAVVDGRIHVLGGVANALLSGQTEVFVYDPGSNTWWQRDSLKLMRFGLSTGIVDGMIYVFGGQPAGAEMTATVEVYDPTVDGDASTPLGDMPAPLSFAGCSAVEGKIYLVGGETSLDPSPVSSVRIYDPASGAWAQLADLPVARTHLSTRVVNGKLYATGGSEASAPTYEGVSTVEVLDVGVGPSSIEALGWGVIKAIVRQ